ncbi:MAG: RNA polymerase sigma factor SigZ [Cyanobacteria bacterium P01_F01_bin.150]
MEIVLEHILSEYYPRIKAFVSSRVSNPSDVDDLLQDILIKSYQNLDSVESTSSLKSWLFQIARNTIIDYYRRQKNSRQIPAKELWYDDMDTNIQHPLAKCVIPFMEALPTAQRELLKAIDLEGQSQKEYAAFQGLAYSTLKSRVKKSRNAMRSLFEDCCHLIVDGKGNIMDYTKKSHICHKDCC